MKRFNFKNRLHIRRTDKISEALYYSNEDYMREIDEYFAVLFAKHPHLRNASAPTVFVASDDKNVFESLRKEFDFPIIFYFSIVLVGLI